MRLYIPTHLAILWLHQPKAAPLKCRCRGHISGIWPFFSPLHHSSTRQIHWFPDTPHCISALYSHLTLDSIAQCYKHCFANTCSLMVSSYVLLTWYNSKSSMSPMRILLSEQLVLVGENQRWITLTWSLLVLQCHICPINTYSDYVTIENKKNEVHHILLKFLIISNKRHSAILPFIASIPFTRYLYSNK